MNIGAIARQCLLDANGDREAAVSLMTATVLADKDLREQVLADGIRYEIRVATNAIRNDLEAGAGAEMQTSPKPLVPATASIDRTGELNWYIYALPGGQPLGSASKSDVLEAADYYRDQIGRYAKRAEFMTRIAVGMKRSTVAKSFTEKKLAVLAAAT